MCFILFLTNVTTMFAASYLSLCFKNPNYLSELK